MANSYIKDLYRRVYLSDFNYYEFNDRMKMQKCIYLAEQFGLNIGDYCFSLYKHGPYSQQLQDDMYEENNKPEQTIYYSEYAASIVRRLSNIVQTCHKDNYGYSEEQWVECLASIHYLNRLFYGDKQKVLSELKRRKPNLNNDTLNGNAYSLVV